MKKAVVFDLFETLITEWGHEKYTKRMLCEDLKCPLEEFSSKWEALHEIQYCGGITYQESILKVCGEMGVAVSGELLEQVTRKRKETKAACFDFLHPEILPMLTALREKGIKIGILSNCSQEEVEILKESKLAPLADQWVLSYEAGLCKPDEKIYRLMGEKLGVKPEECLFIGDGGSRELYGARDVGMQPYRAMWYIRKMPVPPKPQMEFEMLESPMAVLRLI
ncbi:MAG: HAD-IA family hydrolase [Clostridia bacterium]|nr:HAD-IA family hydrolase [Clostridia bacterium]